MVLNIVLGLVVFSFSALNGANQKAPQSPSSTGSLAISPSASFNVSPASPSAAAAVATLTQLDLSRPASASPTSITSPSGTRYKYDRAQLLRIRKSPLAKSRPAGMPKILGITTKFKKISRVVG